MLSSLSQQLKNNKGFTGALWNFEGEKELPYNSLEDD